MAVLRSLLPYGAICGRWVLLSLSLFFAIEQCFDSVAKLKFTPLFSAPIACMAVVTIAAVGMAAYIARLHTGRAALTRMLQEADELQRVSTRITSSDTVQGAVGCVLDALRQQYAFKAAALVPAGSGPALAAWRITGAGSHPNLPESVEFRLTEDPGGHADRDTIESELREMLPGCRCRTTVPVTLPDNTYTSTLVLGFDTEPNLTASDLNWLTTFARGLALPLERVRIQEELARLAYTDPMTGLANYRSFRRHLHEECGRAARYGHAMALLILDVDKFKRVNDQYGHPAGDEVLRHVGRVIQEHVRSIDLPARYGGEEFAVVCPETEIGAALVLAERLRSALENAVCVLPCGETLKLTMSIGVSVYPDSAITETALIEAADTALYQAKEAGRNRVKTCLDSGSKLDDALNASLDREFACA